MLYRQSSAAMTAAAEEAGYLREQTLQKRQKTLFD
jgi:hypothetical protein